MALLKPIMMASITCMSISLCSMSYAHNQNNTNHYHAPVHVAPVVSHARQHHAEVLARKVAQEQRRKQQLLARKKAQRQQQYHMHSRKIDMRQHQQASFIENGIKSGRLTHAEAKRLKQQQNNIHRRESLMKNDHYLSVDELHRLNTLLDKAESNIHTALYNQNRFVQQQNHQHQGAHTHPGQAPHYHAPLNNGGSHQHHHKAKTYSSHKVDNRINQPVWNQAPVQVTRIPTQNGVLIEYHDN